MFGSFCFSCFVILILFCIIICLCFVVCCHGEIPHIAFSLTNVFGVFFIFLGGVGLILRSNMGCRFAILNIRKYFQHRIYGFALACVCVYVYARELMLARGYTKSLWHSFVGCILKQKHIHNCSSPPGEGSVFP